VGEGYVGNLGIVKYNARKMRVAIANMIIVGELPFRFVKGFKISCRQLSLGFQFFLIIL
jgi:hypothetical protein